jgi:hypothetical protein
MSMRATSYYKFTTTNPPKSSFTTKLYTSSIDSTQALQTLPGATQTLQYYQCWGHKPEFADECSQSGLAGGLATRMLGWGAPA